jgi:hypothetical protein
LKFRLCSRLFQSSCFACCVGLSRSTPSFVWSSEARFRSASGLQSRRTDAWTGPHVPEMNLPARRARISSRTTEARRSCVWCPGLCGCSTRLPLARSIPNNAAAEPNPTDVVRDIVHHRMGILCPDEPPKRGHPKRGADRLLVRFHFCAGRGGRVAPPALRYLHGVHPA